MMKFVSAQVGAGHRHDQPGWNNQFEHRGHDQPPKMPPHIKGVSRDPRSRADLARRDLNITRREYPPVTTVECTTTKGSIEIEIYIEWAPHGAARFLDLVYEGFFTDIAMFRTVDKFLSQFGISDNPKFKVGNREVTS